MQHQLNIQYIVILQTSMKSAKLLKGWRLHGRRGMAAAFLCVPALPAVPQRGGRLPRDGASAVQPCRAAPRHLHPSLETGVCSGQEARQRLFPHLGVDGASVDFLAHFSLKCGDICPGHRVETRPCLLVHSPMSSRAVAMRLQLWYGSKSKGGRVGAHMQCNAAYWSSAEPVSQVRFAFGIYARRCQAEGCTPQGREQDGDSGLWLC